MVTVYDYTRFVPKGEVEKALLFGCDFLGIDGVTVAATCNDKLLARLSRGGIEYKALIFKSKVAHIYNFYFRSRMHASQYTDIIFHECVHLAQQECGDLYINPTTGECWWRGEKYGADYPYKERPWEIEAFREQAEIARAYKKLSKRSVK